MTLNSAIEIVPRRLTPTVHRRGRDVFVRAGGHLAWGLEEAASVAPKVSGRELPGLSLLPGKMAGETADRPFILTGDVK
jgi:hypothetical protein